MNNLAAMQHKAREAGRPLIGCFPPYPPLELFTALGLTPMVLWNLGDLQPDTAHADRHVQPFVCSVGRRVAQACLGTDAAGFDAVFMYNACDTLRNLPEMIQRAHPALPVRRIHLPMTHPPQDHTRAYLTDELEALAADLSADFGASFSIEAFADAVRRHENIRALALRAEALAASGLLPFSSYAGTMNDVWLSSLEDGETLLDELVVSAAAEPTPAQAKVVISGILPPPLAILQLMEEAGLRVVANDIASLHRAVSPGPAKAESLGGYYHDYYSGHHPCSTLLYNSDGRRELLPAMARQSGADGVIFIGEKFCECEYFEFPFLQKELSAAGIKSMMLELAIDDGQNVEAIRTRIEAFAETIGQA